MTVGVVSCEGSGCIEADEFDTKFVKVDANPIKDGVYGSYDDIDGGQVADWKDTGLRTANEEFIILVSGGWVPWKASQITRSKFEALEECNICSKRNNVASENCICWEHKMLPEYEGGQDPKPEIGINGIPVTADCSGADQDNPNLCTCTTNNGSADDYGIFHFPLNYYHKDHARKNPDDQDGTCKYIRGMGLYLGVFGRSANEVPLRVYHLFSQDELCPIARDSNGDCIDEHDIDRTKYIFRSKNKRTFVKDDQAGNDGTDPNPNDDIYHKGNEYIKLIIYDRYYSDNYGHYNVEFLKGVFDDSDIGLLEFLIGIVEDQLLGETNSESGEREGGILEFLYNSIVKDSNFLIIFQMALILYVAFFGVASLLGLIELNKKEIYSRILKIGVVILFTNPDSWAYYDKIVVGFFKDGMDAVVDIIVSLGEVNLDEEENPLVLASLGSNSPGSTGSRFSYIDVMIRTLFSENVTKKIWGLFFYHIFGFIYIVLIYAMIAYFIYVMLVAACVYTITLTKLIFVLALGPIFISFSLFKFTSDVFKKWLSFMAARSLEIIILFLLLYTFVGFIDERFNEILYYKVCYEYLVNGYINIQVLKANLDRGVVTWFSMIATTAIFIFITQMILEQLPTLSSALISVGGVSGGSNAGAFKIAKDAAGDAFNLGRKASGFAVSEVGGRAFRGLRKASRTTGLSGAVDAVGNKIPIRGIRTRVRDSIIDGAIKRGNQEADRKGLKGLKRDEFVRNYALNHVGSNDKGHGLLAWKNKNPNKAALTDMTTENINKRLDKKLVQDPLAKYLKKRAKEIKKSDAADMPLGKEMTRQLKSDAREWAKKNLAVGADGINDHLHDWKKFISKQTSMSAREAGKKFGKDDDMKAKYLKHLKDKKFDKHGLDSRKAFKDSKAAKNFLRESHNANISIMDQLRGRKSRMSSASAQDSANLMSMADKAERNMARSYLMDGGTSKDRENSQKHYEDKINRAETGTDQRRLGRKRDQRDQDILNKREAFKNSLSDRISEDAQHKFRTATLGDKKKMAEEAARDYQRMKEEHMKKIQEFTGNSDWKELMGKNGGRENYRDGLIDIGGNSLFEARAKAQAIAESMAGSGLTLGDEESSIMKEFTASDIAELGTEPSLRSMEETNEALAAMEKAVADMEKAAAGETSAEEAAAIQERYDEASAKFESVMPTEPELDVGVSFADAMSLQASDVGLKSGDVTLGGQGDNGQEAQIDHVLIANCEFNKTQATAKIRSKKFEKAQKEYEKKMMESEGNHDAVKNLNREIEDLKYDIESEGRKLTTLDEQLAVLKNP